MTCEKRMEVYVICAIRTNSYTILRVHMHILLDQARPHLHYDEAYA